MKKFSLKVLSISVIVAVFGTSVGTADTVAFPWTTNQPILEKRDFSVNETIPYSINGNIDCKPQKLITRKRRADSTLPELSIQDCVVGTNYGVVGNDELTLLNGTDVAGRLIGSDGKHNVIAIPNSSYVLQYQSAPVRGMYLSVNRRVAGNVSVVPKSDGRFDYKLGTPPTETITDKSGKPIAFQYDSIGFSANGKWMVADSAVVGKVRVNLETLEVLPFGIISNYSIGIGPLVKTAITGSGRYAVFTSSKFSLFQLYDLDTCSPVPDIITKPVSCQFVDLWPKMKSSLSGFSGVTSLRFVSEYTLKFYGAYFPTATRQLAEFFLSPEGKQSERLQYLALGDSFASGEGAYDYKLGTDTDLNKCHLSTVSYPYLIGSWLDLDSYQSVACSGAKFNNVSGTTSLPADDQQAKGKADPLFDDEILNNFLPGYRAQTSFIREHRPSIVTVSVIGNDIGFKSKLLRCLMPDTCFASYEDRIEILREVRSQFSQLTSLYNEIKTLADSDKKIYVIGYPDLVYPNGNCAQNVNLDKQELEFASQLVHHLNETIKQATVFAGVHYVDVQNTLEGHRLCETLSSDVAVNGLTSGNDVIGALGGPIGNESYHPNRHGHQLLRKAVLEKTNNFTQPMPAPNSALSAPNNEDDLVFLNVPKTHRAIFETYSDDSLSDDVVLSGSTWQTNVSGLDYSLAPLSPVSVTLHSDPQSLGTYSTDSSGDFSGSITLPPDIPSGFHTLHFYFQNILGKTIDITKVVYVADSLDDLDGDGVLNANESCLIVPSSGIDYDQDGIDDACDPEILEPPLNFPTTTTPEEPTQPTNESPSTDNFNVFEDKFSIYDNVDGYFLENGSGNSPLYANEAVVESLAQTNNYGQVAGEQTTPSAKKLYLANFDLGNFFGQKPSLAVALVLSLMFCGLIVFLLALF